MIGRAPFGATGHDSSRVIFGAAALGERLPGGRRPGARGAARARRSTTSTSPRATATPSCGSRPGCGATPATFFLATKTGERSYRGAREEIRRSLDRLGVDRVDLIQLHNLVDVIEWETALGAGRRAGGGGRGARGGPGPLHRRHRPRPVGARDAPAQPGAVRLRLGPGALQLRADAGRALRRDVRGAGRGVRRAQRGPADDQEPRPPPLGRPRRTPPRPGTSRCASRPTSTWRCTGCSAGRRRSCSPPGDVEILPRLLDAAERFERRPSDEEMTALAERSQAEPLFV